MYLTPVQIPRSLSGDFAKYQPSKYLTLLLTLPMKSYMGIGSGLRTVLSKTLLDEQILIEEQQNEQIFIPNVLNRNIIPPAPTMIPPTYIERHTIIPLEYGQEKNEINQQNNPNEKNMAKIPSMADVKVLVNQGYTFNLIIAIMQGIVGAFLYGFNTALLNVPSNVIKDACHLNDTMYNSLQSFFCAGGMCGALLAGTIADRIGRKKSLLLADAIFLFAAILNYLYASGMFGDITHHSTFPFFAGARVFVGLAGGLSTAIVPTYLGEISPPLIRGAIGTYNQLMICIGLVVATAIGYDKILGSTANWRYLFLANAIPTTLQVLTLWSFPESPKWLLQKNRESDARKVLKHLRQTENVNIDITLMKNTMGTINDSSDLPVDIVVRNAHSSNSGTNLLLDGYAVDEQPTKSGNGIFALWAKMEEEQKNIVIYAVIIAVTLQIMQQLSGINAVFYYSSDTLKHAGLNSNFELWAGSLLIAVANVLSVFPAVIFMDKLGRKKLLYISSFGMIAAALLFSISLYFHSTVWHYCSIGFLILYVVFFEFGLGPIPWLMMVEIAPIAFRGSIVSLATFTNWMCNLLIAQFANNVVKIAYYFPFAVVAFLGVLFTWKFIPETKEKSEKEIQRELQKNSLCC